MTVRGRKVNLPRRASWGQNVVSSVPPHPGPLPRGAGDAKARLAHIMRTLQARSAASVAPSPWGEGGVRGNGAAGLTLPPKTSLARALCFGSKTRFSPSPGATAEAAVFSSSQGDEVLSRAAIPFERPIQPPRREERSAAKPQPMLTTDYTDYCQDRG